MKLHGGSRSLLRENSLVFIYLLYSLEHIWQGWAYLRRDGGKKEKGLQEEIHQEGGVWTGQPRQRLLKQLVLGSECFSSRYCSPGDGLGLREYGCFCVKWKSWALMGRIPGNPGPLERRVSLTKRNPGEQEKEHRPLFSVEPRQELTFLLTTGTAQLQQGPGIPGFVLLTCRAAIGVLGLPRKGLWRQGVGVGETALPADLNRWRMAVTKWLLAKEIHFAFVWAVEV